MVDVSYRASSIVSERCLRDIDILLHELLHLLAQLQVIMLQDSLQLGNIETGLRGLLLRQEEVAAHNPESTRCIVHWYRCNLPTKVKAYVLESMQLCQAAMESRPAKAFTDSCAVATSATKMPMQQPRPTALALRLPP